MSGYGSDYIYLAYKFHRGQFVADSCLWQNYYLGVCWIGLFLTQILVDHGV